MQIIAHHFAGPAPLALRLPRRRLTAAVPAEAPGLAFSTVRDRAGLEALEPEWEALFAADGQPQQVFQTFAWLRIWASLYLDRRTRLCIVTGRRDGRLVLVWPLVVRRIAGVRVLTAMGEPLSQYADALLAAGLDAAAQDAAFDYLTRLPVDVIALRKVREDAVIAPLLRRRLGAPVNPEDAPFVDFSGAPDVAAFEARFPSKVRSSRKRRRRRLEERGPVNFVSHAPSSQAAALVPIAFGFKRDWARQSGVLAPALFDPRFERFFATAARDPATGLRLSALTCGEEVCGIEISVACKGRLYGHVLAPRPDLGALGVGGLLAEATVVHALADGLAGVDLLAPADSYKREWTALSVGVGDYGAPLTLRGVAYTRLWLHWGRQAAKDIAARLRPTVAAVLVRGGK